MARNILIFADGTVIEGRPFLCEYECEYADDDASRKMCLFNMFHLQLGYSPGTINSENYFRSIS